MLGIHPEIQDKVYEEIYNVFGDSDREIEIEDLSKLTYMEMVLKETLRHFPSIVAFPRRPCTDLKLATCTVAKDVDIAIIPALLHKNEKYWENPDIFDPMRFTSEECAKRHPYAYLPFSLGPRMCLG